MQREHGHLRAEELSIRLFTAMADKIRKDPEPHLTNAKWFIEEWRKEHPGAGGAAYYFNHWESLLNGPLDELLEFMVSSAQEARDMRQAAPFVRVLSNRERWNTIRKFSDEWRRRQRYA